MSTEHKPILPKLSCNNRFFSATSGNITHHQLKMHFYLFVVFAQLVIIGLCWVSEKCFVYEGYLEDYEDRCQKSNLTGYCNRVSNVELDLAGIPSHLEVLCLNLEESSELHPNSLSRFYKLKTLQISLYSNIYPGAFKKLLSLQSLQISCLGPQHFSLSFEVLSDLKNVTSITVYDCRLSSTSTDVFRELKSLENLFIHGPIMDFSDLLCSLSFVSKLKYVRVEPTNLTIFTQPDCTFSNRTHFELQEFHGFERVTLVFPEIKVVDKTVLKYFPEISVLKMDFEEFDVLKAFVKRVDDLIIRHSYQNFGGFENICKTAHELSVIGLHVTVFQTVNNFTLNLEKCATLKSFSLGAWDQTKLINLTFIKMLRNLTVLNVNWLVNTASTEGSGTLEMCENQSNFVTKIKKLSLSTKTINSISYKQFSCFQYIERLDLGGNIIKHIEDFTFNNTVLLEYLDLSYNKITKLTELSFFGLRNLKTLILDKNMLITVEPSTFIHLTSLDFLSLGVFQFPTSEPSEIQINLSVPENLTNLYISSGIRPMTLHLDNSRETNSTLKKLHVFGQSVTFLDCENLLFESLVQLTAETEQLLCGQTFPARFLKSLLHLKIIKTHKAAQMDLTDLNQLVNLQSLLLTNIDLSHQPGLGVIFHNLSSLEYLDLNFCWINSLEKDLTKDLKSLKILVLYIDGVFSMMESFVEPLKNLKYLIMRIPLLQCSCDNAWFTKWPKYQQNIQVHVWGISLEQIPCKGTEGTKRFYKYAHDNCFIDIEFLLFASTSLGLVFFMLVVLLHQLAGDYLLAFYHIARGWIEEAMMASRKGQYLYDVFVSYCGKDEQWVMEELLPNLEKRGPPFLRICLHSRDFQLGKDIVENITDSLYRSRFTLCLVSHNYLRSNWCSLEMRLATYRLLVEHKDVLVLIFLEKIPNQLLNAHHRLARLVKTQTYINWPQDPALHNAFWDRLWAKLAPKNATQI